MANDPSRIRVSGPLAEFVPGFGCELARQGYANISRCLQMRLLVHLSRWLLDNDIEAGHLNEGELEHFLRARRAAGYKHLLSIKALRPALNYLRGLGIIPPPVAVVATDPVGGMLEQYRRYLTVERRLANSTADAYVRNVRPFLNDRVLPNGLGLDLEQLTAADVLSFMVARCHHCSSGIKEIAKALRSFLRFLHVDGVIKRSLVSVVPPVAGRRLATLPKALKPDQVCRLLASCDKSAPSGCRDIAILIMLVRLGLRAIEVARLRLDDIDWQAGEIIVHGKTDSTERLPLPQDVGAAVVAYLQRGRPASAKGRSVFVRIKAPHRALHPQGVSSVVVMAARRAGLGVIHAHRLRHTAATEMLHAGASLSEISQLLRHRHVLTTAIYAKVDREALRAIARPWPGDLS